MDATTIKPAINAYSRTSPPCSSFSSSRTRREITAIVILLPWTWPDRSPPQPLRRPIGQVALSCIGCKGGQRETTEGGNECVTEAALSVMGPVNEHSIAAYTVCIPEGVFCILCRR